MTARARAVTLAAALCAMAGWAFGYPSLFLPLVTVAVLLVAASARIRRNPDLEVTLEVDPARIPRGDAGSAIVTVTNRGRRSFPSAVCSLTGPVDGGRIRLPTVPAGESRKVYVPLDGRRRGVFWVGPLQVTRSDDFGLFSKTALWGNSAKLVVHPAVETVVAGRRGALRGLDGDLPDAAPGSVEFSGLRDYVPGDDRRRVHWRSTARRGRLMVREMTDTLTPSTVVALDTDPGSYPDPEDFERAVDIASSILVSAAKAGPVLAQTGGGLRLRVAGGEARRLRLMDELAVVAADGRPVAAFAAMLGRDTHGASLILVTGTPAAGAGPALVALRRAVPVCSVLSSVGGVNVDLRVPVLRVPEAGTLGALYREPVA